jgi:hypothetical protein
MSRKNCLSVTIIVLIVAATSRANLVYTISRTAIGRTANSLVYPNQFDTWEFQLRSLPGSNPAKNYDTLSLNFTSSSGAFLTLGNTTFKNGSVNPVIFGFEAPDSFFVLPPGRTQLAATQTDTATNLQSDFTTQGGAVLVPSTGLRTTVAAFSVPTGTKLSAAGINFVSGAGVSGGGIPDRVSDPCLACFPPSITSIEYNNINPNTPGTLTHQFAVTTFSPTTYTGPYFDSYIPDAGAAGSGPATPPTFDPSARTFNWFTSGSPAGTYRWHIIGANDWGSDVGYITAHVTVPEPGAVTLFGMSSLGIFGVTRRRCR